MKKGMTTSTSLLSGSHGLRGARGIEIFCGEEGQGFCFYDDLSQARWNWLIMIFKVCFFFVSDALLLLLSPLLYSPRALKQKLHPPSGWRNQKSSRRLHCALGLIASGYSRGGLRLITFHVWVFFVLFGTARSTSSSFLFFLFLFFSPYYWIIKGITVHLVDCSTLPKVVDKLFDVEVSKFGPWYQTLGLRWKTSLGCWLL